MSAPGYTRAFKPRAPFFCSSPMTGQGSGANDDLGPLRFIVRAVALEEGGGDLAPGLGIGDRHELAAVVELGGEADLLLVAAQKHAADRAQGPERDQADEAPAGGAGQLLDLGHGSELQLDVDDRRPRRRRKLQEEKWCRL